jgi:hypothetical protein
MSEALQRVATEWFEVRAGRIRVVKGHPTHSRMNELRKVFQGHACPAITAFWVTRDKRIHFKPNFPADLRQQVREIVIP